MFLIVGFQNFQFSVFNYLLRRKLGLPSSTAECHYTVSNLLLCCRVPAVVIGHLRETKYLDKKNPSQTITKIIQ